MIVDVQNLDGMIADLEIKGRAATGAMQIEIIGVLGTLLLVREMMRFAEENAKARTDARTDARGT